MLTRTCRLCEQPYPATTDYFYPDDSMRSGLRGECRECWKAQRRAHKRARREQRPTLCQQCGVHVDVHRERLLPSVIYCADCLGDIAAAIRGERQEARAPRYQNKELAVLLQQLHEEERAC